MRFTKRLQTTLTCCIRLRRWTHQVSAPRYRRFSLPKTPLQYPPGKLPCLLFDELCLRQFPWAEEEGAGASAALLPPPWTVGLWRTDLHDMMRTIACTSRAIINIINIINTNSRHSRHSGLAMSTEHHHHFLYAVNSQRHPIAIVIGMDSGSIGARRMGGESGLESGLGCGLVGSSCFIYLFSGFLKYT